MVVRAVNEIRRRRDVGQHTITTHELMPVLGCSTATARRVLLACEAAGFVESDGQVGKRRAWRLTGSALAGPGAR
jgi:MarR-like DNA-binding transcriptional regulator SgrR of sgrS sRNA